jgi:hypothetical protein
VTALLKDKSGKELLDYVSSIQRITKAPRMCLAFEVFFFISNRKVLFAE